MKKLVYSVVFSFTLLFLFTIAVQANNSRSLSDLNMNEVYRDVFGKQYTAPYSNEQHTKQTVDTDTGALNLNQVDLSIPGKNGLDVVFSRSFNSQFVDTYWYVATYVEGQTYIGKGYLYEGNNGKSIYVHFRNEEEMLHFAPEGFYTIEDYDYTKNERSDMNKHHYYESTSIIKENGTVYFSRVKTVRPINLYLNKQRVLRSATMPRSGYQIENGWMFSIPYICYTDGENEYDYSSGGVSVTAQTRWGTLTDENGNLFQLSTMVRKKDGVYTPGNMLLTSDNKKQSGIKVEYVSAEGAEKDGFTYNRTVTKPNGLVLYFKDASTTGIGGSYIQAMEDKYGNRITYQYQTDRIVITDSYGREITVHIAHNNIADKVTSIDYPDPNTGQTRTLQYLTRCVNNDKLDPNGDILTLDDTYYLTVRDAEGHDTVYTMQKRQRVFEDSDVSSKSLNGNVEYLNYLPINQTESEDCFNVTEILYPTGAKTKFTYQRRINMMEAMNRFRSKHVVSKRVDVADGKEYNEYTYTYDNPEEGTSYYKNGYQHTGTMQRTADGYKTVDTYQFNRRSTVDYSTELYRSSTYAGAQLETTVDYTFEKGRLKSRKVARGQYKQSVAYVYDDHTNITKATENDFVTDITYDTTYNMPLTTTYKQDENTTILQENTLTEDKKSIDSTVVKVNGVIKSKTKFTYDQYGNVTAKQMWENDSNGDGVLDENDETVTLKTDYTYNPDHTWSLHNYVENVQDADGNTEAQIGYTAAYDALGNVKTVTDPNGNITSYTYDVMNRPIKVTFADGTTRQLAYNIPANEVTYTDENGTQTKSQFDPLGQIEQVLLNDAGWKTLESYEFNNIGQQVKKTTMKNASDYTTEETTYNPDGTTATVRVKNANGSTVTGADYTYSYTATGRSISAQTLNDPVTKIETYDLRDRKVKEEAQTSGETLTTTYEYDYLKNVIAAKDARANANSWGNTTTATYDHMGNVLTQTNALGNTITNTYNLMGQLMSSSDYKGNVTSYVYDKMGRNIQVSSPFDGTNVSKKFVIYDKNGNVIREKSQNNAPGEGETYRTVEYVYNSKNQVTAVKQFDGDTEYRTAYTYDNAGNQTSLITGAATNAPHTTSYTYNKLGQVVSETDPMGGVKTATYDYLGNVTGGTTKAGETITNTYNDWNLPVMQQVTGTNPDTNETRTDARSFTYDNLGRKVSATNESGTATYEYDDFGRMVKETDVTGAVKEYTYDENGNRLTFILTIDGAQQMNATYTYDKLNQLTGVTIGGDTTTYGYDANGNIVNKTTGALVTTYSYNSGNMLTEMNTKRDNSSINTYAANYFLDGNLKRKAENQYDDSEYTYNGLGQLTSDISNVFNTGTERSYNQYFTYDAYGNRASTDYASATGEMYGTVYQYNANNQLIQKIYYAGGVPSGDPYITTYAYDANGNQSYKLMENHMNVGGTETVQLGILGEDTPADGSASFYTYNGFGQMTQAIVDGTTAEYAYNPDGLRVSKTVEGTTTTHILDGSNVVADIKDGNISKYNRGRGLISIEQSGNKGYYTFNGHGDVTGIVDGSGSLTNKTQFYAFGNEIYQESIAFDNPFGYAGEYTDTESGNIYLRARYYDPSTGRFTSEDTHWNPGNMIYGDNPGEKSIPDISAIMQSGNVYVYCMSNPIKYMDVTGKAVQVTWISYSTSNPFKYNGNNAVAYSQDWYNKRNPAYPDYGSHDCTNFVSQCLFAGGMPTSDKWKNYMGWNRDLQYVLKATDAWANARESYEYFANPDNGVGKYIVTVYSSGDVRDAAYSGYLKVGDVLYFSNGGTDSIYHAALIVGIYDGEIYYAAHSDDHAWKSLGNGFFKQQETDNPDNFNVVYIMHFFPEGA